ncbi:sigma-70 family RNA polymerase sigma factor [Clostridium swellfunianum]|uniref:sigma-70 family RNA polymerase sigma factor n=1 Tax=Clostridium swellfunianum TaxID=1367462 RepID=UPI00203055CC|nr:sigma-70 family RNA polymerase sigma factor [Clostridium swellfunianum]MCM0647914.1 sigma-70 family RNA polymerase sigma factor [Clostridium swellfunianum]
MNPHTAKNEKIKCNELNLDAEIERMIDIYGNDVLRISYLYLKDVQRAEDALQEVFMKVYTKYGSFKGHSSEKTWIMRITINVCKDILRGSWLKRVFLAGDVIPMNKDEDNPEPTALRLLENRMVFDEVVSLRSTLKDVVILYYYEDFDTNEISSILGIAEGTVRSRLHRARDILRNKLKGRIEYFE